ncbi:MAG TPA: hypothetical protein VFH66_12495 [Mycobacteriales bacterium]|nr:hypothetical protein [Mycobacteriales bacterium]
MRKFVRLSLVAGAASAVIGGAMVAGPSFAAPGGGECTLDGVANFSPGPGTNPTGTFAYDFGGDLSGCNSSESGAPAGGHISAGQQVSIGGVTYQEPKATGTGSCGFGQTAGTAIVQWADGTISVINYTTTSAAAGVALQGTVVPSATVTNVSTNTPATINTTRYAGDGAAGALAFEVSDPSQCAASTGVVTAGIQGVTGIGHQ